MAADDQLELPRQRLHRGASAGDGCEGTPCSSTISPFCKLRLRIFMHVPTWNNTYLWRLDMCA